VLPLGLMSPFTPAELELLLCGVATLDVEEWRKASVLSLASCFYFNRFLLIFKFLNLMDSVIPFSSGFASSLFT